MALSPVRRTSTLPAIVSFAALPVLAEEPKGALLVGERLVLQPDLQYIVNPGLSPSAGNAWAVGLRVVLSVH